VNTSTRIRSGWRTIGLLAITLLVTATPAALGQFAISSDIAPGGTLRVALISGNPVLVSKKPDGSIGGGVSVELGRFIAERLGVPFQSVYYADPELYTRSFGKGEWDVAIGPRRASEAGIVDFSPDFMLVENNFVAAPGRTFGDAGEVDRPGIRVAVIRDGSPDKYLTQTFRSAQLVRVASGRDAAIEALRSGAADAFGSNAQNVHDVAEGLPGSKIVPGAFNTVPMAVALPKGRSAAAQARLAEIVKEAKGAGLVQKAIEQARVKGVRVAPH
jgi:polar amino acid transport system substrate-binding protein